MAPAGAFRYLALGDSYTIGEGVPSTARWPNVLARLLAAEGAPIGPVQIVATTGWTTADLLPAVMDVDSAGPFDLVTLLIGVNNQYQGRSLGEYRDEFRALLARAIDFSGARPAHVIVLSIPDWGVTPFAEGRDRAGIARDIDAFNIVNYEETEEAGARYVDVTAAARAAGDDPAMLAADGLHPSAAQYRLWADLVLPLAHEVLVAREND